MRKEEGSADARIGHTGRDGARFTWIAQGIDHAGYRVTPWIGNDVFGWTKNGAVSELSSSDCATDYIAFVARAA